MAFDRVIVASTNDHWLDFWPLVCAAWEKWFPSVEVSMIVVPDNTPIPAANHAKIMRYQLAAQFPDDVCLVHDMDTIPLQAEYYRRLTDQRIPGHLLCVGREVYNGTPHAGKFPAGCMTGEGRLFKSLMPGNVEQLFDMRVHDHKEDPRNLPERFSDESLVRALLTINQGIPQQHVERGIDPMTDWVDRSWWHLDVSKMMSGGYIEANLPRPMHANMDKIQPIWDYIFND